MTELQITVWEAANGHLAARKRMENLLSFVAADVQLRLWQAVSFRVSGMTYNEVGEQIGCTRARASMLIQKGVHRIERALVRPSRVIPASVVDYCARLDAQLVDVLCDHLFERHETAAAQYDRFLKLQAASQRGVRMTKRPSSVF